MRKLMFVLSFFAIIIGGWYLISPWLAMNGLVKAAEARDEAALDERIDFERLRGSTKAQLQQEIEEEARGRGPLGAIGGAIVEGIAGGAVDLAFNPSGMANIITLGAAAAPLVPDRFRNQDLEWDVERIGFDEFRGVSTWEDGNEGPVLIFERDGIGWEVVAVDLRL